MLAWNLVYYFYYETLLSNFSVWFAVVFYHCENNVTICVLLFLNLDREHGDFLRCVNVVPNAQVASVLRHNHVTQWNPLHIRAVVQDGCSLLALDVVQVELKSEIKQLNKDEFITYRGLSLYKVTKWHSFARGAVVQNGCTLLAFDVAQVQLQGKESNQRMRYMIDISYRK